MQICTLFSRQYTAAGALNPSMIPDRIKCIKIECVIVDFNIIILDKKVCLLYNIHINLPNPDRQFTF